MKRLGLIGVILLCLVLAGSIACSPLGGAEEEVSQQLVEVVRGDLIISVSGSGKIEISDEAQLAFGSGGKVEEIYVEEGDEVREGDALAMLDTGTLELALTQARLALIQAEVSLETAKFNLDRMEDVQEIKDDIEDAEYEVKVTKLGLKEALQHEDPYAITYWTTEVSSAEAKLAEAQQDLAELLGETEYASFIVDEVIIKRLQVEAAEESVAVTRQSLEQAQKQLDEATITAPFDGVVAAVYADEGDVISAPTMAPTVIIYLVDPATMELRVDVDEIDVPGVKPGRRTIISVDALPELELEGEVTSISSLAKEEAGLVLYEVKTNFAVPEGSGLRIGMSATADIVIDERSNVLLVPDRAIKQDTQGNPVVEVMVSEQIEERRVVVGVSDGFQTEVVDGLNEGDMVVTEIRVKKESAGGLF